MSRFLLALRFAAAIPYDEELSPTGHRKDQAEAEALIDSLIAQANAAGYPIEMLARVAIDAESGKHSRELSDDDREDFLRNHHYERAEKAEKALGKALSENRALRDEIAQAHLEKRRAISARDHSYSWWSPRLERLKELAKEHGIWDKMACIIANGTASGSETPRHSHELVHQTWRAERAEKERDELVAQIDMIEGAIRPLMKDIYAHRRPPLKDKPWHEDAADAIKFFTEAYKSHNEIFARPTRNIEIDLKGFKEMIKSLPGLDWYAEEVPPRRGKFQIGYRVRGTGGQPIANLLSTAESIDDETKEKLASFIALAPKLIKVLIAEVERLARR